MADQHGDAEQGQRPEVARPQRTGPLQRGRARLPRLLPRAFGSRRSLVTGCTSAAMLVPMLWVLPGQAIIAAPAAGHRSASPQVRATTPRVDVPRIDRAIVRVRATTESATTGPGAVSVQTSNYDIPQVALAAYQHAANVLASVDAGCRLPWTLLAAIGKVESDNGSYQNSRLDSHGVEQPALFGPVLDGRNGFAAIPDTDAGTLDHNTRWDRAVGPMQFLPATWRVVAVDGDADGIRNPQDINDAALAAAVYLCAAHQNLATVAGARAAALRYNHSTSYADLVVHYDQLYRGLDSYPTLPMGGPVGLVGLRVPAAPGVPHAVDTGRSQGEVFLPAGDGHAHDTWGAPKPPKQPTPPRPTPPPASTPTPAPPPASTPPSGSAPTTTLAGTWATCAQGYCVGGTVLAFTVDMTATAAADLDGDGTTGTWAQELAGLVGQQVKLTVRQQEGDDVVVTLNGVDAVGSSTASSATTPPASPPQAPPPSPPPAASATTPARPDPTATPTTATAAEPAAPD